MLLTAYYLHQLPQRYFEQPLRNARGLRVLLVGTLKRHPNDARSIGKNGLVGDFDSGSHEVSKHAGHAAIGNEIGDNSRVLVGEFVVGAEENLRVSEGYISTAAYYLRSTGQQLL